MRKRLTCFGERMENIRQLFRTLSSIAIATASVNRDWQCTLPLRDVDILSYYAMLSIQIIKFIAEECLTEEISHVAPYKLNKDSLERNFN